MNKVIKMNFQQERLLRFECFLALGFGLTDCAKLISPNARGVGRVSYFFFGATE